MRNKVLSLLCVGVFTLGISHSRLHGIDTTRDVVIKTLVAAVIGGLIGSYFAKDDCCREVITEEGKIIVRKRSKTKRLINKIVGILIGSGIGATTVFLILNREFPENASKKELTPILKRLYSDVKDWAERIQLDNGSGGSGGAQMLSEETKSESQSEERVYSTE